MCVWRANPFDCFSLKFFLASAKQTRYWTAQFSFPAVILCKLLSISFVHLLVRCFLRNERIDFHSSLASIAFHFFSFLLFHPFSRFFTYIHFTISYMSVFRVCFYYYYYYCYCCCRCCSILCWKIPHYRVYFYFQCILAVIAIIAVSNAIPFELGHYASPIYAPVAKAIVPEPIVSAVVLHVVAVKLIAHVWERNITIHNVHTRVERKWSLLPKPNCILWCAANRRHCISDMRKCI